MGLRPIRLHLRKLIASIYRSFHLSVTDTPPSPAERSGRDMSSSVRRVASATGLVSIMVLLSRGLGFVRDAIIAALFGQGPLTDAYRYGFQIPDTLWMLVAGG